MVPSLSFVRIALCVVPHVAVQCWFVVPSLSFVHKHCMLYRMWQYSGGLWFLVCPLYVELCVVPHVAVQCWFVVPSLCVHRCTTCVALRQCSSGLRFLGCENTVVLHVWPFGSTVVVFGVVCSS